MQNFYFPNINVAFTSIPKTGITTLKDYFFKLERLATAAGTRELVAIENLGGDVHNNEYLESYKISNIDSLQLQRPLKILILRNPYRRALSAWINKFLLVPHDWGPYSRFQEEDFVPKDFKSISELSSCFEKFTERLSSDLVFRESDPHWRPQSHFVSESTNWDFVLETSQLDSLRNILGQHLSPHLMDYAGEVPKHNDSDEQVKKLIGSDLAWLQVESAYQQDFSLMKKYNLDLTRPDLFALSKAHFDTKFISDLKSTIERNLARTENKHLKAQISKQRKQLDEVFSSMSWRYTAWARKLFAYLMGIPKPFGLGPRGRLRLGKRPDSEQSFK